MRGLMFIVSVVVVVMSADASSIRLDKIETLEVNKRVARQISTANPDFVRRVNNFWTRINIFPPTNGINLGDFEAILLAAMASQPQNVFNGRYQYLRGLANGMSATYFVPISSTTETAFLNALQSKITSNTFSAWANGVLSVFFQVVDADGNGKITQTELVSIYSVLFIDSVDFALPCFAAEDANGDGFVTQAEYIAYGTSYFVSATITQGMYFWGHVY